MRHIRGVVVSSAVGLLAACSDNQRKADNSATTTVPQSAIATVGGDTALHPSSVVDTMPTQQGAPSEPPAPARAAVAPATAPVEPLARKDSTASQPAPVGGGNAVTAGEIGA